MLHFKRMRFLVDVMLVCMRWYTDYRLSYRQPEEMMAERGGSVAAGAGTRRPSTGLGYLELPLPRRRLQDKTGDFLLLVRPI